jgi:anti-sigma factor ChrR (cupin superfamily)
MATHLSYDVLTRRATHHLSSEEALRAERHLAHCGRCRDEQRWLERIGGYAAADQPILMSAPARLRGLA